MSEVVAPIVRRKKRRKRAAYVVYRPLKAFGALGFLFKGTPALCHWGLFLSTEDHTDTLLRWYKYCRTKETSCLPCRGTMFELVRLGSLNSHDQRRDFRLEAWDAEWGPIGVDYVGETDLSDVELDGFGDFLTLYCSQ